MRDVSRRLNFLSSAATATNCSMSVFSVLVTFTGSVPLSETRRKLPLSVMFGVMRFCSATDASRGLSTLNFTFRLAMSAWAVGFQV